MGQETFLGTAPPACRANNAERQLLQLEESSRTCSLFAPFLRVLGSLVKSTQMVAVTPTKYGEAALAAR